MDIAKELIALADIGAIEPCTRDILCAFNFALKYSRGEILDNIYKGLSLDIEYAINHIDNEEENVSARLEALQAEFEKLREGRGNG